MNKFLDESNIVKKEPEVSLSIDDAESHSICLPETYKNSVQVSQPSIIPNNDIIEAIENLGTELKSILKELTKNETKISEQSEMVKTREDIVAETLNRFQTQMLLKDIDVKLYQALYDNANNTEERKRYKMTLDNLREEIKILNKKIEIVKGMTK
jgi:chromosome condensin MukBEF ATPase and DNA-binding subunit MukB